MHIKLKEYHLLPRFWSVDRTVHIQSTSRHPTLVMIMYITARFSPPHQCVKVAVESGEISILHPRVRVTLPKVHSVYMNARGLPCSPSPPQSICAIRLKWYRALLHGSSDPTLWIPPSIKAIMCALTLPESGQLPYHACGLACAGIIYPRYPTIVYFEASIGIVDEWRSYREGVLCNPVALK